MSFTNTTPNYGLPQYVPDDKPTYLGDFNKAMLDIDTNIKAVDNKASSSDTTSSNALNTANEALSNSSEALETANSASTLANNIKIITDNLSIQVSNAVADSSTAKTQSSTALSTANSANTTAEIAKTLGETIQAEHLGTVLFENVGDVDNSSTNSFTLSDSIENYKKIEIEYFLKPGNIFKSSGKIASNHTLLPFDIIRATADDVIQIICETFRMEGNQLTRSYNHNVNIVPNQVVSFGSDIHLCISSVIGFN